VREDNLFSNYFKNRYVKAMRPFWEKLYDKNIVR
jgi:hypothetical protein